MTTPRPARCGVTDMLVDGCEHCRRNARRDAAQPVMFTAPPRFGLGDRPPIVEARHYGTCDGCGEKVEPGEMITKDGDVWVHVGCEE